MKTFRVASALGALALAATFTLGGAAPASADTYEIDGSHSNVIFAIEHLGVSRFYGQFTKIAGKLELADGKLDTGKVSIEIDAESVYTANRKRDDHLKSPDFFKVKQFPKITFVGEASGKGADGTIEVKGELTLLGVTKPVTLQMKHVGAGDDPWGGYRSGYEGRFTIKRSEFGMTYMEGGLGDEVELIVAFEAVKK